MTNDKPKTKLGYSSKNLAREMNKPHLIGITFDTNSDFKFNQSDPSDWDAEFQVSVAVDDIVRALEDLGHRTALIGSGQKLTESFHDLRDKVDIVFNIAEGRFGRAREAQIPALLEMAQIPFVGSDAYALSLSLNKWHTKIIGMHYGIRTPEFVVIDSQDQLDKDKLNSISRCYPMIAKLCYEGSSMGLDENSKIHNLAELKKQVRYLLRTYKQPVIAERFITGSEVDVPVIGNKPKDVFGVVGISLDHREMEERYLTSKAVYHDEYTHIYPLNKGFEQEASEMALHLYNIIGCRDFGRVDMRIDEEGRPYFLEINPYP